MKSPLPTLFLATLALSCGPVFAEIDVRDTDTGMFPTDVSYNLAIPTPASMLGHELGAEPVRHHKLVEYITTVANLSDRLSVEVIGYTHERRPILFVVATSPANQARIDELRAQHVALTEPAENPGDISAMPMVTWLNYGVHGAESSGMDASLPFIYYLAAAQGDEIERILSDSIVLVTAIFNPDGHSKRVAWFDAYGGRRANADPAHIEHTLNWGFARTNHYWFDLNRQWLLLTQPEPRAWMRKWHEWRPNLTIDYHEMGSEQTYYFHPGVATRTNPLAPDEAERLMAETAKSSEAFLDSERRLYFQGESFDNYYIGKGSTFPLVNGGVGILYEAGAALGRELETANGLRTYRENIRKHFRTSIASIRAGARLRTEYLQYQRDFYVNAMDAARQSDIQAWVFAAPGDPARMHFFADLLNFHRINTYRLTRDVEIDGRTFAAADALIVPSTQAQHVLIRGIFETVHDFEDATFYDVSTFTLPPAFGLDYAPLGRRDMRRNLVGEAFSPPMPAALTPDLSTYAYVFEWGGYFAPRALQRVFDVDLLARVATEPFTAMTTQGDVEFARGSIVVPFDRQETAHDTIHELMQTIAADDGLTVHALTSGRSAIGTAGIQVGGPSVAPISEPSVLVVVGDEITLYDAGEIWHLLDYRMHMPVTLRDRDHLDGIDWSRYTHIVFSSGEYEEYLPDYAGRLRQWVAEGGTIIGLRDAAPWVRSNVLDWIDPESPEGIAAAAKVEEEDEEIPERMPYAEKSDHEAIDVIGGAIFSADLDNTHPLGFGFRSRDIQLHKNTKEPLAATTNPFAAVISYTEDPIYSGYASESNREALASTPALIAERLGNGSVILFADNPNFRGYWYGTNKLFLNALFFSTVFEAPAED